MEIKKAIEHYNYGISHDIFSEPVTSYARLAVDSLEKQIAKKPNPDTKFYGFGFCPTCNACFLDNSTNYCGNCGQKLDWK
jgi:hypothetical protein